MKNIINMILNRRPNNAPIGGISFKQKFYQNDDADSVSQNENAGGVQPIFLSKVKPQNISTRDFMQTAEFDGLKNEYVGLVSYFKEFLMENAKNISPPIQDEIINNAVQGFDIFSCRISNVEGDFFSDHRDFVYGVGKEYAHEFKKQLESGGKSLRSRVDAVIGLSESIATCSGGVLTAFETSIRALKKSNNGAASAAIKVKSKMIDALILDHIKDCRIKVNPGNEVHLVNAYYNGVAESLGLPRRRDPFNAGVYVEGATPDNINYCRDKIISIMTPQVVVKNMAESYLNEVKGIQDVDVSKPISGNDQIREVIARVDDLKKSSLDEEYGDVDIYSYIDFIDGGPEIQFTDQSTLIAKHFLSELKEKDVVQCDDAVSLHTDQGDGAMKVMGGLLWKEGQFESSAVNINDLLRLNPKGILRHMQKSRIGHSPANNALESLVDNICVHDFAQGPTEALAEWCGHAADLVRSGNLSKRAGGSLLNLAITTGLTEKAASLIRAGASLEVEDSCRNSPIFNAAKHGHVDIFKALLKRGVKLDQLNNAGESVYSYAAVQASGKLLDILLDRKSYPIGYRLKNILPQSSFFFDVSKNGETPVSIAAASGNTDNLIKLEKLGADLTQANSRGQTPLICAAMGGHCGTLLYLFGKNSDVNLRDNAGLSALTYAIKGGYSRAVEVLLANGARSHEPIGDRSELNHDHLVGADMDIAVRGGNPDIIRLLVNNGCDIERRGVDGDTPLVSALRFGKIGAVNALIGLGANVNARTREGVPVLSFAALTGNLDVVRALLNAGADAKALDVNGGSTLQYAYATINQTIRADIERELVGHGAVLEIVQEASVGPHNRLSIMIDFYR